MNTDSLDPSQRKHVAHHEDGDVSTIIDRAGDDGAWKLVLRCDLERCDAYATATLDSYPTLTLYDETRAVLLARLRQGGD